MAGASRPPDPPVMAGDKPTQPFASFAEVARSRPRSRFPPIKLAPRQYVVKDGRPVISFTKAEIQPGKDRLQFAIVAKFSSGRPHVDDIRRSFASAWGLEAGVTIGALDARHILIILLSGDDVNKVLAHPMRKVGQSLFRLFRWSPDFHSRKEPTTTTAWVKLPGLPPEVFDEAYIAAIVSSVGRLLAVDERTRTFANPSYARACIELDLSKELPSELVINILGDRTIFQPILFEGNLSYCSKCKLHGHHLSTCRKAKAPPSEVHKAGSARQIQGLREPTKQRDLGLIPSGERIEPAVIQLDHERKDKRPDTLAENGSLGWEVVKNRKHKKKALKQGNTSQATKPDKGTKDYSEKITQHLPKKDLKSLPNELSTSAAVHSLTAKETARDLEQRAMTSLQHMETSPNKNPLGPVHQDRQLQLEGPTHVQKETSMDELEVCQSVQCKHAEDDVLSASPLIQAGDDDHIDIVSAMVVYQDQHNNSNEDLQSSEVPLPEEIVQKLSSYGSNLFCEKDGEPADARAVYLHFKAIYEDDAIIFEAMDEAVNAAKQAQKEGSGSPVEDSDSSVDLSLLLKKPPKSKKGSRFSGRSRPKKKDPNFVW